MASHAEDGGIDDAVVALKALSDAAADYNDKWNRPLTEEELVEAREAVMGMVDAATSLEQAWSEGDGDRAVSTIDISALVGTRKAPREIIGLVEQLNRQIDAGHRILGELRPAILHAQHFVGACDRVEPNDVDISALEEAATGALESLEVIERRIEGDVNAQRARVEVVSMYSQLLFTSQLNRLTMVIASLTIVLVVVALAALGITVFITFFH